jgi:hypothetical protein
MDEAIEKHDYRRSIITPSTDEEFWSSYEADWMGEKVQICFFLI